jgi:hypothetical protein
MGDHEARIFLAQWERHVINSLLGCRGKPTILVPSDLSGVPYHKILMGKNSGTSNNFMKLVLTLLGDFLGFCGLRNLMYKNIQTAPSSILCC